MFGFGNGGVKWLENKCPVFEMMMCVGLVLAFGRFGIKKSAEVVMDVVVREAWRWL